ncbi:MAG: protein kinase domain-containing protein, partial [Candidatus Saccharimonadales bacterium]
MIHRDVKPSNCFLDGDGRVKIGDFGLSKSLVSDAELTKSGSFLGTPQFAAPEQVKGGVVDQRTDVYAVGATLFCLLTGRGPFVGDAAAVIAQIVSDPAPPLSSLRPDVRRSLDRIVARTLEKNPARRYQDLAALRRALAPFATGGVSMADIGRRLAAYMLDLMLFQAVTGIIFWGTLMYSAVLLMQSNGRGDPRIAVLHAILEWLQWFADAAWVGYFAFGEAYWGRSIGKRMMGLRVVGPDGDRPGLLRSLLRSLIVPGAMWLVGSPEVLTLLHSAGLLAAEGPGVPLQSVALHGTPLVFIALCATSMRARNGYRGWHEWASGTRVVRLRKSAAARRQRLPVVLPVTAPDDAPCFGPFRPLGRLGHSGKLTVSAARDELLGRAVWI